MPARPRHALAGLEALPPGPLTLVPPARKARYPRTDSPGQLANGGLWVPECVLNAREAPNHLLLRWLKTVVVL